MKLLKAALIAVSLLPGAPASAQTPALSGGTVRVLVGFPAGGTIDVVARLVAQQMGQDLGASFIVENLTGAGGQIAAQALKRAAPDGRTLMVAPDHTMTIIPLTMAQPGFDPLTDFAAIGRIAEYASAMAVPASSGARDLDGFFRQARADAKSGSVGIPSPGSKPEFALIASAKEKNVTLTAVPYRGSAPLVQDLAGAQLPAGITALGDFLPLNGTQLRVIAITSAARAPQLPDVRTAAEQGYPMKTNAWIGMFAPARAPDAVVAALTASMAKALAAPVVIERMNVLAFDPRPSSPEVMADEIRADAAYWGPLVSASGWVKQ